MGLLCQYKDSLGVPKQGFHSIRMNFFGLQVARNDFIGTIFLGFLLAIILTFTLKSGNRFVLFWSSLIPCIIFMFGLGIILHWIFCVNTTLNTKLIGTVS